jgi:hypothetical protein
MVEEAKRRCDDQGRLFVADLAEPLPLEPRSLDGITCSLALHYLHDDDLASRWQPTGAKATLHLLSRRRCAGGSRRVP